MNIDVRVLPAVYNWSITTIANTDATVFHKQLEAHIKERKDAGCIVINVDYSIAGVGPGVVCYSALVYSAFEVKGR